MDPDGGNERAPQSWNRYAYVMGNPLKYTDPEGLFPVGHGLGWASNFDILWCYAHAGCGASVITVTSSYDLPSFNNFVMSGASYNYGLLGGSDPSPRLGSAAYGTAVLGRTHALSKAVADAAWTAFQFEMALVSVAA